MQNLPALNSSATLTMTSREMAELTEIRHDSVKRTIETLADKGVIQSPQIVNFKNINNVEGTEYLICKRDSYVIVAQLSPEFTARLVDRWQELEAKQLPALPSYSEALRQLADTLDKNQELIALNEAQKPAVEFVGKYVKAENLMGFRQVAKLLKIKEPNFRDFLQQNEIMYKLNGEWVAYAQHLNSGRFSASTGIADNEHAYTSHKFTAKGIQWIAGLMASKQILLNGQGICLEQELRHAA